MDEYLTRDDRLWLGAHGHQDYAGAWEELRRADMLAAMDPYDRTLFLFERQLRALTSLPATRWSFGSV